MTNASRGRGFVLALAIAVFLIPAALGSSATLLNDGDVSWHLATGQWILAHAAIPHADPFSFTWGGKPWVPIEWLAELILAAAHRLGGYSGLMALATLMLVLLHAGIFLNAARHVRPFAALGFVIAVDVVLIPMMFLRPHLLVWPLLAGWAWLLLRAREADRAPPLAAALLMAIWVNLHGSYPVGLGLAAAFGLEAWVAGPDRSRVVRQWGLFGLACLAASLLNANGLDGILHPFRIANLAMLPLIDEWKPSSLQVTPWFFAVLAITLVLVAVYRPRLSLVRWAVLAGLLALALLQTRHQALLAIVAAMLLPTGFPARPLELDRRLALTGLGAVAALLAVRLVMPFHLPENETNPWRLVAQVPPELRKTPVLNGYSMGGPLILSGIRPMIDGRGDMYGDALVIGYKRIVDGDAAALNAAVRRYNIRWAILPSRYTKLLANLDRAAGWRRIASTEAGVVCVRTGA